MKQYTYHVFLRHPETRDCKVMDIEVDNDGYMDANTLIDKLRCNTKLFESGYTLIGLNVGLVIDIQE